MQNGKTGQEQPSSSSTTTPRARVRSRVTPTPTLRKKDAWESSYYQRHAPEKSLNPTLRKVVTAAAAFNNSSRPEYITPRSLNNNDGNGNPQESGYASKKFHRALGSPYKPYSSKGPSMTSQNSDGDVPSPLPANPVVKAVYSKNNKRAYTAPPRSQQMNIHSLVPPPPPRFRTDGLSNNNNVPRPSSYQPQPLPRSTGSERSRGRPNSATVARPAPYLSPLLAAIDSSKAGINNNGLSKQLNKAVALKKKTIMPTTITPRPKTARKVSESLSDSGPSSSSSLSGTHGLGSLAVEVAVSQAPPKILTSKILPPPMTIVRKRSPNDVLLGAQIVRPHTAPQSNASSEKDLGSSTSSCLRKNVASTENASITLKSSRQMSVSFAPDTLDVDRENKPKKFRVRTNRKPKFAHPSMGHFLPPTQEIIAVGPESSFGVGVSDNPYTKFNTVWCGPLGRISPESMTKKSMRIKRFKGMLANLSTAHDAFNKFPEELKAKLMMETIIPRYIAAMDIALMDGELEHVDSLLHTIISSLRILQLIMHDKFFDANGKPKSIPNVPQNNEDFMSKYGALVLAMNRLTGEQSKLAKGNLSVEATFIKLQLELLILTLCPWDCVVFRSQLAVAPATSMKSLDLLQKLRERRSYYSVKWVNDSVMHRDYMSLLKFFGFCDEIGAKNPVPLQFHKDREAAAAASSSSGNANINANANATPTKRPATADAVLTTAPLPRISSDTVVNNLL